VTNYTASKRATARLTESEFRRWAVKYSKRGWPPIPIGGPGGKGLLVKGVTGYNGVDVDDVAQFEHWARFATSHKYGLNIGVRVPLGVIGIDVDCYDGKHGRQTLTDAEKRWGKLPPTWRSTARTDGSDTRWFRLSPSFWSSDDYRAIGKLPGGDVEVIQRHHRYGAVAPSMHKSGKRYRWMDPKDQEADSPPPPEELPELPPKWIEGLTVGGSKRAERASRSAGTDLIESLEDAPMSSNISEHLTRALDDIVHGGSRYDAMNGHVISMIREGALGGQGVPTALRVLRHTYVDEVASARGSAVQAHREFDVAEADGSQIVAAEGPYSLEDHGAFDPGGLWHADTPFPGINRDQLRELGLIDEDGDEIGRSVFKVLGPTEWASEVPRTEFLIGSALCRDTFGVNGGPKKSLKTHDNQAIAFAVATGTNLYRSDRFPVHAPGKVLYVVGEGGEIPVRRTLQRMARAYDIDLRRVRKDPDFPLVTAFGAAPIDSAAFRDSLRRLLDKHQPDLVLIESFYNFHPGSVEAGNLYQRGQLIDEYHRFVRGQCVGAVSLLTDHFRSTAGRSLDLDNISMAGQAENADSWIMRQHSAPPDVPNGEFKLRVGFGSRQWGGTEWEVAWHLGAFDHDAGHHDGEISWDVAAVTDSAASSHTSGEQSVNEQRRLILEFVVANPSTSKSNACAALGAKHRIGDKKFRAAWESLAADRLLVEVESEVERKYRNGTRTVKTTVWKRGNARRSIGNRNDDGDSGES
jgi:hypothetical protein